MEPTISEQANRLLLALVYSFKTGSETKDTESARPKLMAYIASLEADRADARRYRFLRPFLETDSEVDDPDSGRAYSWLQINDERIALPDAYGWENVDAAVDAAIASLPQGTPTP